MRSTRPAAKSAMQRNERRSQRRAAQGGASILADSHRPHHADGRTAPVLNTVGYPGAVLTDVPAMRTVGVIPRSTILTHPALAFKPTPHTTLPPHPPVGPLSSITNYSFALTLCPVTVFGLSFTTWSLHQSSLSISTRRKVHKLLVFSVVLPFCKPSRALRHHRSNAGVKGGCVMLLPALSHHWRRS